MLKVSLECIGEGRYDAAMAAIHVCGDVDSFIIIISAQANLRLHPQNFSFHVKK
jgi:hypothetical protein